MSDWTLGAVKDRNMDVMAFCETDGCRFMAIFGLDELIETFGRDFRIGDLPPMSCEVCGAGPMKVSLGMGGPPEERGQ